MQPSPGRLKIEVRSNTSGVTAETTKNSDQAIGSLEELARRDGIVFVSVNGYVGKGPLEGLQQSTARGNYRRCRHCEVCGGVVSIVVVQGTDFKRRRSVSAGFDASNAQCQLEKAFAGSPNVEGQDTRHLEFRRNLLRRQDGNIRETIPQ